MHPTDQYISTLKLIDKSSNMENLKEFNKLKLNSNKVIKKEKRKIKKILLYGKQLNPDNQNGLHLGVKVDLVGILNALQWLQNI